MGLDLSKEALALGALGILSLLSGLLLPLFSSVISPEKEIIDSILGSRSDDLERIALKQYVLLDHLKQNIHNSDPLRGVNSSGPDRFLDLAETTERVATRGALRSKLLFWTSLSYRSILYLGILGFLASLLSILQIISTPKATIIVTVSIIGIVGAALILRSISESTRKLDSF